MNAENPPVLDLLRSGLGAHQVSVEESTLQDARADRSGLRSDSAPLVVVYAESLDDVVHVMRSASSTRTPVVVRGAGTGLAGGGFASDGEIVLSLERMTTIHEINEDECFAVVDPGVINGDFDRTLRERGFWFAPDPASRDISSVGGNIATNAGGLMCAKYGVTREAVLGLTVVLADGSVIETGRRTAKGVTGLDLTALLTGSEGTLGVIARACVRIRRVTPGEVFTIGSYFPTARDAAVCASAIGVAGLVPLVMEIMDARALAAVHDYLELPAPPDASAHLLLQFDGPSAEIDSKNVLELIRSCGGDPEFAQSHDDSEQLLRIRRSMHPALAKLGTTLIEDVCVPRSRLADMFDRISQIEQSRGISIPTVAHAGDGNLHPNFLTTGTEVPNEIWDAANELFLAALELGGTLTGEHGVGVLKKRWLVDEIGETQLALQERVKLAFDPDRILNPGKVF